MTCSSPRSNGFELQERNHKIFIGILPISVIEDISGNTLVKSVEKLLNKIHNENCYNNQSIKTMIWREIRGARSRIMVDPHTNYKSET